MALASEASYCNTAMRGAADAAQLALAPQKNLGVNDPTEVAKVLKVLKNIQDDASSGLFNNGKVSLADLIVMGGVVAIKKQQKIQGLM